MPQLDLRAVASSRTGEIEAAGLQAVPAVADLLDRESIDLVVVASPNETHFPIASAALKAGKHVVVDKPLANGLAEAEELIELANERGRMLVPFHNRRWDGDFLTVRELIESGSLGEVTLYEAYWDRFRPQIKEGWRELPGPGAGLLFDLGTHMIDQALLLFGKPDELTADIETQRADARVDDYFSVTLHYGSKRAVLGASTLVAQPRPRFSLHGTGGSFVKLGLDPQEEQLKNGAKPNDAGFGDGGERGTLTRPDGIRVTVQTKQGCYRTFYERVADAILNRTSPPLGAVDARDALEIVELARRSAAEGRRLPLART